MSNSNTEVSEKYTVVSEAVFINGTQGQINCQQANSRVYVGGVASTLPASVLSPNVYLSSNIGTRIDNNSASNNFEVTAGLENALQSANCVETIPETSNVISNESRLQVNSEGAAKRPIKRKGYRYNWDKSAFEPVIPVRCKTTNGMLHKSRFGSGNSKYQFYTVYTSSFGDMY